MNRTTSTLRICVTENRMLRCFRSARWPISAVRAKSRGWPSILRRTDLLVLANRGARIVLGMPRGFYPGYDGEVHEVYVFEKVK